jgi:heme o synthase
VAGPAAPPAPSNAVWFAVLFHTLLGTALVAGGTNALNQVAERDLDALMRRTQRRPLPAGRLAPAQATVFAWTIALAGLAELALFVNRPTAFLAAATLVSYVFLYTPLKRRTSLATLVGAVPGALPIVGGWAAAAAPLDIRAGTLFGLMFLWQIPHFLALAWIYREDYERAGMKMLSVGDMDGAATFRQAMVNAAALLPVGLVPFVLGMAGAVYFAGALVLSAGLFALAVSAAREPSQTAARRLFLATLVYLPAILSLMAANRAA